MSDQGFNVTTATRMQSMFDSFSDWVRTTDDHAEHHLALLERADRLLTASDEFSRDQRQDVARKLERWRYQHLHELARTLSTDDEALVDALDVAANQLAGRLIRPPRATRHAVCDASLDSGAIAEAVSLLASDVPLDNLARRATDLTCEHFGAHENAGDEPPTGRRILLYAPLYVSNDCVNYCTYCGFRFPQDIVRKHLTVDQAVGQARILRDWGFRHVLVVGGDFPSRTTTEYYRGMIEALARLGIAPAIEIAPQTTASYAELVDAGVCGLTLYQETYDLERYAQYHPRGPKASYHWRLESHDRAAEAGVKRLGLGFLVGLAEPRREIRAMMRHAAYLARRFPGHTLAFSLPRIHEAPEGFRVPFSVSDDDLVRLYCVLRIAFPRAELVLSTREPVALRNRLARICITQMSAGSSTAPGGYQSETQEAGEQFPVADHRSPTEVAQWLRQTGFRVTWAIESTKTA